MDENQVLKLMRAFYNHEIDDFNLYVEGFGGLFISRTKDGMVMGFVDKNKRFGPDDHVTVFFDRQGLKGLHRKVGDAGTDVYMTYNVEYFQSPEGIRKLVQDMQNKRDMPFYLKTLLMVLYKLMRMFYGAGFKNAVILEEPDAQKLGMKSPCIFVRPGDLVSSTLPLYNWTIRFQRFLHMSKFGERLSEGFAEQHFPGSQIRKHSKRTKRKS
jgi:hypothetical protein